MNKHTFDAFGTDFKTQIDLDPRRALYGPLKKVAETIEALRAEHGDDAELDYAAEDSGGDDVSEWVRFHVTRPATPDEVEQHIRSRESTAARTRASNIEQMLQTARGLLSPKAYEALVAAVPK
jgi:hypothetical protein